MTETKLYQKFKDSTPGGYNAQIFSANDELFNRNAIQLQSVPSIVTPANLPIGSAVVDASVIYGNFSATTDYQKVIKEQIGSKSDQEQDKKALQKKKRKYQLKELSASLVMELPQFTQKKKTGQSKRPEVWHCCKSPVTFRGKEKIDIQSIPYIVDQFDRKHFSNLQHCDNHWLCPICASMAASDRASELFYTIQAYIDMGYLVNFVTLTVPHYANECLQANLKVLLDGFDFCKNHRSSKAILRQGATGENGKLVYVRALEPTIGKNGWHPHLHCIFITRPKKTDQYLNHFRHMWLEWLDRIGRYRAGAYENAVNIKPYQGESSRLSEYMCKWGIVQEISHTQQKIGRSDKEGYSPFEILGIIQDKLQWDLKADPKRAFQDYAVSFKGKSMIRYSTDFFQNVGIDIEELRIKIAEERETKKRILFEVDLTLWYKLMNKGLLPEVHTAYQLGGLEAMHNLFLDNAIPYIFDGSIFVFDYPYEVWGINSS